MYCRILVPLDGSPLAERALPYALVLAGQHGSQLVLIRAAEAHVLPGADLTEAQRRVVGEAEDYLAGVAASLSHEASTLPVATGVYYGDPVHGILDEIQIRGADLVVMSTHGRTGVGRMILGSVTDQVLRHAQVPVILIPASCEHTWACEPRVNVLVPPNKSAFSAEAPDPVRPLAA